MSDYDPDLDAHEAEPERICPVTGAYCTGLFCDDYGCAKEAGIWDNESDDGSVI